MKKIFSKPLMRKKSCLRSKIKLLFVLLSIFSLILQNSNLSYVFAEELATESATQENIATKSAAVEKIGEISDLPHIDATDSSELLTMDKNLPIPDLIQDEISQKINSSAVLLGKKKIRFLDKKNIAGNEKLKVYLDNLRLDEVEIVLKDKEGESVTYLIEQSSYSNTTVLNIFPANQFRPGKYKLIVTDSTGEKTEQDFTWGVLAINPNKATYGIGETAKISIAVLDEEGRMVCSSKVSLEIIDPKGEKTTLSTDNLLIKVNPECGLYKKVDNPDFETEYLVKEEGLYYLNLTAENENGEYSIKDQIEGKKDIKFDIERVSATRIFPPEEYSMAVNIIANEDFEGQIIDIVPESFKISQLNSPSFEYSSVSTVSAAISEEKVLGADVVKLRMPFNGKYAQTLGFSDIPDDEDLQKEYENLGLRAHDGIDFALPEKTEVLAAGSGTVVLAEENSDYGNTVAVKHDWGHTYYGHLKKISVKEGQIISKGDVLGLSGNTGFSTGPHLHFAVRPDNNDLGNGFFGKVDPAVYLGLSYNGTTKAQVQRIAWKVNLKKGEKYTIGYNYLAPMVSPQFYLIGKLKFISKDRQVFEEGRQWQIAADGASSAYASSNSADGTLTGWVNPTYAYNDDGSQYATRGGTSKNTWYGTLFGFDLSGLPDGASVTSVTLQAQWHNSANDSSGPQFYLSAKSGGVEVGTGTTDTSGQTTDELVNYSPADLTIANLKATGSSGFWAIVRFRRTDNTAHTAYLDYVSVTVNYNLPPTISITQPDGTSDTIAEGGSYNVTYNLSDEDDVVTAGLYYDSNNSGLDGTAISGCSSVAEASGGTCSWDTTGVTPGNYYVYGWVAGVYAYSPGVITINDKPTLTITQPDGTSDEISAGTSYNITYGLEDTDDTTTVSFYYDSNNSGADGTAITGCANQAEGGAGTTCAWDTTGMAAGSYYVYGVTSGDSVNGAQTTYSSGQITFTAPAWSTLTQRQGIIENDSTSATLTSHTAEKGERLRVKIQLDTSSGDDRNQLLKLQYDKNDSSWVDVKPSGEIKPALSLPYKNGQTLGGPEAGTCNAGTTFKLSKFYEKTGRTPAFDFDGSSCYEFTFAVNTKGATEGTTYRFRLVDPTGTITLTYSSYPSFTVTSSSTKLFSKSNVTALASGTTDLVNFLDDGGYDSVLTNDSTRDVVNNIVWDTTSDLTITGSSSTAEKLGSSTTSLDINGDGYLDMVVGIPEYNPGSAAATGQVKVYFGGQEINSTADVTLTGEAASNYFGASVSSGSDVNGDGYEDLIVGATGYNPGSATNTGRAYIFYGSSSITGSIAASSADVTLTGEAASNYFGRSVAGVGDANDDGYDDVLVGADGNNSNQGEAYLYYGGASMNSTADLTFTAGAGEYFGFSVSSADVNGDYSPDLLIGAYGYSTNTGRVYIYNGGSSVDNTSDATLTGGGSGYYFGYSVSGIKDANGDNYGDVVVGAYGITTNTGAAYVYFGGSGSFNTTADGTLNGPSTNSYFGKTVGVIDDINNDGYADVAVGATGYDPGSASNTGRVYVYYGAVGTTFDSTADITLTGLSSSNYFGSAFANGDIDANGFQDILVGGYGYNSNDGVTLLFLNGINASASNDTHNSSTTPFVADSSVFFGVDVGHGDFNGDGYQDFAIGASRMDTDYTDAGQVWVYYGSEFGVELNLLAGNADITIDYPYTDTSAYFGISVSSGDVNGDGYDDLIVGADMSNATATDAGRAFVYFGGASFDGTKDVELVYDGSDTANFGRSVASGDFNGDGIEDILVGAFKADNSSYTDEGKAYIFYGATSMSSTINASSADEAFTYPYSAASTYYGISVDSGDFNGDGYDDAIIGAYQADYSGTDNWGKAFIYYGASGTTMDNTADVELQYDQGGANINQYFGSSVSSGDFNGDGYDDAIVGARWGNVSTVQAGRTFIFLGSSSMSSTITSSNANVELTNPDGTQDANFGRMVKGGDINGDGYDDAIVCSPNFDISASADAGKVFVYYGNNILSSTETYDLSYQESSSPSSSAIFGYGFTVADFNNDGYKDLGIGAYGVTSNLGKAFINYSKKSEAIPVFNFAEKSSTTCTDLSNISVSWNGQSSIGAGTNSLKLQYYNTSTSTWTDVDTETSASADSDFDLTSGTISSSLGNYCDGSNWSYWRVYQASGNNVLRSDYFDVTFSTGGSEPETPTNDKLIRHGAWFDSNGVRQPFTF